MHHKILPESLISWCHLAGGSKGQCRNLKLFVPWFLAIKLHITYFFQKHVLPTPFLSQYSLCVADLNSKQQ